MINIYLKPFKTQLVEMLFFLWTAAKYTLSMYEQASFSYKNVSAKVKLDGTLLLKF